MVDSWRQVLTQRNGQRRRFVSMHVHHPVWGVTLKRCTPGQHFKQHYPKRIRISTRVNRAANPLFRGHVRWRADDRAAVRERRCFAQQFGDPEIGQKSIAGFV